MSNNNVNKGKFENVAVAIDKDKGSQFGFKWAVDNVLGKGQGLTLLHVKPGSGNGNDRQGQSKKFDTQTNELFLPFRCFCRRKEVKCNEVVVDDTDVARGLIEYVNANGVDALVFGSASRGSLARFKSSDIPGVVSKGAPDFCTVYVIVKGKISSIRNATSPLPAKTTPVQSLTQSKPINNKFQDDRTSYSYQDEIELKSPFTRNRGLQGASYNSSVSESDISFASNGRSNTDFPSMCSSESGMSPRNISTVSTDYEGRSFGSSTPSGNTYREQEFSSCSQDSGRTPYSPQAMATDFNLWKSEEKRRLEEARLAEEAAMALVEKERAKCKAALEAAEAAQRIAELEAKKRVNAEMRIQKEADERKKATQSISGGRDLRYRRYTIEEIEEATNYFATNLKIGEGGYGPVYRCYLDHTPVAIKVLRPDAAQGRSQFQQEVTTTNIINFGLCNFEGGTRTRDLTPFCFRKNTNALQVHWCP
ncbi:hypothetical protein Tsubulata_040977 [Turnera subulata]|uniref:RING-type E3 ubiquitin transferase n=1 Tax=Turnera subulata TaxID=218843 RepID=A0A9Q0G0A5_9ROSI|nr:hypothetical protein Tsubulata_040977 [Turnera subulata]